MSGTEKKGTGFIKQAAILAAASLLVRVLGFLYRLPLTDMIGDEGNGIYSAGFYLYNMFLIMSSAGLPVAISRMVAEKLALGEYKNARKIFRVSMLAAAAMGFLCMLIMFVFASEFCTLIKSERSFYCIMTLAPTVFIVSVMAVYRGYFQGFGTTVPTAVSQLIEQIFNAVFSVFMAWYLMKAMLGDKIAWGAAGGTAGTGIGALAGLFTLLAAYFLTRRSRRALFAGDKGGYKTETGGTILKNLLRIAIPVITGTAIFSMTNLIDMAMVKDRLAAIGTYTDKEMDALYGLLTGKYVTLTTLPVSISTAIATAVIPSIASSLALKQHKIVQAKVDTTLRLTMMISIPAAVGLGVLGNQILMMLFPNHPEGGTLLRVGALSVIFLALSQISTGVLQGLGRVNAPAVNALWGSLAKIPVNYFLIAIPQINVAGAVISTTVCYMIASLLNFRALVKATGVRPDYTGMLLKPAAASAIMGVSCFLAYRFFYMLMPSNTFATLFAVIIAMLGYMAGMIAVKGFVRDDLVSVPMGGKLIRFLEKINRI
ncbi:MAG: polysaccharide biosynthesis protein [Firmicutes bacterium]|nr:polysaccharide biosynthesis protein [Bacillota bacterium]